VRKLSELRRSSETKIICIREWREKERENKKPPPKEIA
jgi:hypothetical protein